jgi:hypothetical protein
VHEYIRIEVDAAGLEQFLEPNDVGTMCRMDERIAEDRARSLDSNWSHERSRKVPPRPLRLELEIEERVGRPNVLYRAAHANVVDQTPRFPAKVL